MINIACCGIIENNKRILITKRKVSPFKDKYVLPGGKLDEGENLIQCLRREIFEEVGLNIIEEKFFDYYEVILPDRYYLVMYFICKPENFKIEISKEEISDIKWINKQELSIVDLAQGTKKILEKYFNDCNN